MTQLRSLAIKERSKKIGFQLQYLDEVSANEARQDRAFGEFLTHRRKTLKLSQYAVSKYAGITERRYQALENGQPLKSVTVSECAGLSSVLKLDKKTLFSMALDTTQLSNTGF